MKRQLKLTKNENVYILSDVNDTQKSITINNKTINGLDLYSSFYEHLTEKIEYEIDSNLKEAEDSIIIKQIKYLFNKIDNEINRNCFKDLACGEMNEKN